MMRSPVSHVAQRLWSCRHESSSWVVRQVDIDASKSLLKDFNDGLTALNPDCPFRIQQAE
jgi:hypothetical protein